MDEIERVRVENDNLSLPVPQPIPTPEYREENIALVRSEKAFNSATKNIRRLNKRRNLIYDNLVMTGEEKELDLRRLDDLILEQAKRANAVLDQNIKNLELNGMGVR